MKSAVFRLSFCALILAAVPAILRAEQGLVAHYTFDEGTGSVAGDSSGNGNDGTLVNGASWVAGVVGGALRIDGSTGFVSLANGSSLSFGTGGAFTIAGWLKTTDLAGPIVSLRNSSNGNPVIDVFVGYSGANSAPGKLMAGLRRDSENTYYDMTGGTIADGAWHHFTLTRSSGGTIELFLDAVSQVSRSATSGAITTDLRALGSERRWVMDGSPGNLSDWYLDCSIDDIRIYNRQLSTIEIRALLPQVPPAALPNLYVTAPGTMLNVSAPGVLANDTDLNGDALIAVLDTDAAHGSLALNPNGSFSYTPDDGFTGSDSFTYHADDGNGNNSAPTTVTLSVASIPSGLIAWYKFDEGSGSVANDWSGNGNSATLQNGPSWTAGIIDGALNFDGVDDKVALPNNLIHNNKTISVALWFKGTGARCIAGYQNTNATQFVPLLYVGTDGFLRGQFWNNAQLPMASTTRVDDSLWHLAVIATSTNSQSMYLDGNLVGTRSGTIDHLSMSVNQVGFGKVDGWQGSAGSATYFNGSIDDVRVYNRTLSQADVQALIPQAAPAANADSYSTPPNTPLNVAAPGVLSNDGDINGDPITAIKDSEPSHGSVILNADGSFIYTPQNGFAGSDSFTYHADDGLGNPSLTVQVSLHVAVLPAGLIAYYRLDETAGVSASDASGNNNNGYLAGMQWAPAVLGNGLSAGGANPSFSVGRSPSLEPANAITVAMWAKVTDSRASAYATLLRKTGPFQTGYILWWSGLDGYVHWRLDRALKAPIYVKDTNPNSTYLNGWHFFAATYEGTTGVSTLYVDGVMKKSATGVAGNLEHSDNLFIMSSVYDEAYVPGKTDEIQIYNRSLTEVEIQSLMQTFVAPGTSTTAADVTAQYSSAAQNITLNATVSSPTGPATDGRVVFQLKSGAANIGNPVTSAVLDNGAAAVIYTIPAQSPAGEYTIEANYSGSIVFPASSDNSHKLTFNPVATTTSASNAAIGQSATAQNVTLSATITSAAGAVNEGSVLFQVKDGATDIGAAAEAAVNAGVVSVTYTIPAETPLGTYFIHASYTGTNYQPSSDNTHTLKVVEPNTMTVENASIAYKAPSQSVTLNAQVTGAAGTVNEGTVTFQIKNGAANVGAAATSPTVSNGAASASYSLPAGTPAGTYSIFASYSGGPNFPSGSDNTKTLTITRAATGTTPANSTAPYSFADQSVLLSVQVTSSAGAVNEGTVTIQLKSGAQNLGLAATSPAITTGTASLNYVIPGGTLPGVYTIQASYSGGVNFDASNDSSKTLTILKSTPVVTWPNPADIAYGTGLGPTQLNASVGGIPGTFVYNPASGTVLAVGNAQQLSVTFTPNDTVNYNSTQKTVTINVTKKSLTVTADNQSKLFGSPNPPLTASYSGFVNGESAAVLTGAPTLTTSATTNAPPGNYPITVSQGTLNAANYSFTFINGALTISNQPAFFNLSAPNVPYGTPTTALSGKISFGAAGSVSITFNGVTKSATIDASGFFSADFSTSSIEPGAYPIQYFYPGGGAVGSASDARTLTIIKATPVITWSNPLDIPYGTQLSGTQLNATANVAGNFAYNPPAGTVLSIGSHQLSVDFAPADTAHYVDTSASVTIVVGLAQAVIAWATPADISYGTALSDAQLNATADVAGTLTYDPPAGTILNAGDAQQLKLTFVPDDAVNYATSIVTVTINVLKAEQTITFAQIADQEIGSPALTLSAAASSSLLVTITLVAGNATLQGNVLSFNGLGAITLRAEQAGDANFNAAPTLEQTFHVIIIPPHLTSALTASGTQNQPFAFKLTASGTQPVTFESGTLPAGLSLNANTGDISGTPTASGAFQIAVTARNGGGTETKTLTLVFASSGGGENHAPKFVSGVLTTPNPAAVNQEVTFTAAASDEDGDAVAIVWDFGDGTQGFGSTTTHRYATPGIFSAKVTITDGAASDYLNFTVVVNAVVIPNDQYKQYVVSKLGLKFNFAKPNADSLSISGTIPVPAAFSPAGKAVRFESGDLEREWTLDKKATSPDKGFKLTGKLAKDGTFTASPAKFALALKNQSLFVGLAPLGFVNDNTPKGMIVSMPVILVIEGTGYLVNVDVKYAAKKGKSGSGKK